MSYKDYKNLADNINSAYNNEYNYDDAIVADYLMKVKEIKKSKENPFVFFYENIISKPLEYNYYERIGKENYKKASADALSCLEIQNDFMRISSRAISSWLINALHFVDHFVLFFIQDIKNHKIKSYPSIGLEKARYKQMSEYTEDDVRMIGFILIEFYDYRNKLSHRTIKKEDGKQQIIKPNYHKINKTVKKHYPDILKRMLNIFKDNRELPITIR